MNLFLWMILALVLAACVENDSPPNVVATQTPPLWIPSHETETPIPTATESPSPTPTLTLTHPPTATQTPSPTMTSTWAFNPKGEVIAPILLYHHIDNEKHNNRYYVSEKNFRQQMLSLRKWGYTSITISQFISVLVEGGELPPRPVVITFDDGDLSVYENAFSIMQEMGFVGVAYIVSTRLESDGFVNVEQLDEMLAAGWELGSHSVSHPDLTADHEIVRDELLTSRLDLNAALGVEVTSFAYPFGKSDTYVADKTEEYGYSCAVGLGKGWKHTWGMMYHLKRIEIHGDDSLDEFAARLPWNTPPQ
ncbi:MAG: polysaccharide deacetylase family protein [Chloroflexota bacterium]|nr:polysaccharide deacetylase family protein [Chloroflexota bacterium]